MALKTHDKSDQIETFRFCEEVKCYSILPRSTLSPPAIRLNDRCNFATLVGQKPESVHAVRAFQEAEIYQQNWLGGAFGRVELAADGFRKVRLLIDFSNVANILGISLVVARGSLL